MNPPVPPLAVGSDTKLHLTLLLSHYETMMRLRFAQQILLGRTKLVIVERKCFWIPPFPLGLQYCASHFFIAVTVYSFGNLSSPGFLLSTRLFFWLLASPDF